MKSASSLHALIAVAFLGCAALASATDPSDSYLHAYTLYQDGMKAVQAGQPETAMGKLKSAQALIQKISDSQPAWQPALVAYRLQKIENVLKDLTPAEAETAELTPSLETAVESR